MKQDKDGRSRNKVWITVLAGRILPTTAVKKSYPIHHPICETLQLTRERFKRCKIASKPVDIKFTFTSTVNL